jgi:hypothetical protein
MKGSIGNGQDGLLWILLIMLSTIKWITGIFGHGGIEIIIGSDHHQLLKIQQCFPIRKENY